MNAVQALKPVRLVATVGLRLGLLHVRIRMNAVQALKRGEGLLQRARGHAIEELESA